jgi:hypothetical protein
MNLPAPLDNVFDMVYDNHGRIALVDFKGAVVCHVPVPVAHDLVSGAAGRGEGFGGLINCGSGEGDGSGHGSYGMSSGDGGGVALTSQ